MYSKSDREPTSYLCKRIQEFFHLTPVDSFEVKQIIIYEKISPSGYADISHMQLKASINHISVPLSRICNLSLAEGVFLDHLKLANVAPLYKAGDSTIFVLFRYYV